MLVKRAGSAQAFKFTIPKLINAKTVRHPKCKATFKAPRGVNSAPVRKYIARRPIRALIALARPNKGTMLESRIAPLVLGTHSTIKMSNCVSIAQRPGFKGTTLIMVHVRSAQPASSLILIPKFARTAQPPRPEDLSNQHRSAKLAALTKSTMKLSKLVSHVLLPN